MRTWQTPLDVTRQPYQDNFLTPIPSSPDTFLSRCPDPRRDLPAQDQHASCLHRNFLNVKPHKNVVVKAYHVGRGNTSGRRLGFPLFVGLSFFFPSQHYQRFFDIEALEDGEQDADPEDVDEPEYEGQQCI